MTSIIEAFKKTRRQSCELIQGLSAEDCQIQAMPDVSPMKWHLAHTTWFFDTFLLKRHQSDYQSINPNYDTLFNSYYIGVGEQFPRAQRGLLTRPSLDEVMSYRKHIDEQVTVLLANSLDREIEHIVRLGIAHEQQHQELMLMDMLYNFSVNPMHPALNQDLQQQSIENEHQWLPCEGGLVKVGAQPEQGFCFDNECPQHQVFLEPFCIAKSLVTNADFIDFIEAGGYSDYRFWHSDGFAWVKERNIRHPQYWQKRDNQWHEFTPAGLRLLELSSPVKHISYYEAYAYAQFKGARLPTEFEWEHAASTNEEKMQHCFDSVWQWTQSAYQAYPKFRPFAGNAGEYNGKFMLNQQVLRGSSYFTPTQHSRVTYRNFFYPHQRWVCAGIRLAKDMS